MVSSSIITSLEIHDTRKEVFAIVLLTSKPLESTDNFRQASVSEFTDVQSCFCNEERNQCSFCKSEETMVFMSLKVQPKRLCVEFEYYLHESSYSGVGLLDNLLCLKQATRKQLVLFHLYR